MTYTLVVTGPDGRQHARLTDYRDEEVLIAEVRHLLSAEQPRIAIARGSGEAVTLLGTSAGFDRTISTSTRRSNPSSGAFGPWKSRPMRTGV